MLVLVTQDEDHPTSATEPESEDDLLPAGTEISEHYVIGEVIGSGGMATVYVGYHLDLDRMVAIKVMHPWLEQYPELNERFLREARTQATLSSPNIATVHDLGMYAGSRAFIVSELVQGHDLRTLLTQHGALPLQPAVNLIWQAAVGLSEAHAAGIVHRDIKPENLMLCRSSAGKIVKIIDFGIAKIQAPAQASRTRVGDGVMGSPAYMAPEQFETPGSEDARADVWALGAVLFELIGGQPAFDGDTLPEICCKVVTGQRPGLSELRPGVPEELEAIVSRCLALDPDERFADAAELAAAVRDYSLAAPAAPPSKPSAGRFHGGRWALAVSALIGLAALVASRGRLDTDSLRASAARLVELSGARP
jgi:serine/threonine protein kinase